MSHRTVAPHTTIRLKDHPFFKEVHVAKTRLRAGEEQSLAIAVKNAIQEVIVLSAAITYPNGDLENVSVATSTRTGQLQWQIPTFTSAGYVSFVVSAGSGGCCGGDTRKRGLGTLAPVRGSFEVRAAEAAKRA